MLEVYEAGGDQAGTIVMQPRFSWLNLPKLAREVLILAPEGGDFPAIVEGSFGEVANSEWQSAFSLFGLNERLS